MPNDNDVLGLVTNFTDPANHYRIGWGGGGGGTAGATGATRSDAFLVREVGGVSTLLDVVSNTRWLPNITYAFSITRTGSNIHVTFTEQGLATPMVTLSAIDSTFTTGGVGLYTQSQEAEFTELLARDLGSAQPSPVPLPAGAWLLLSALGAAGLVTRRAARRAT